MRRIRGVNLRIHYETNFFKVPVFVDPGVSGAGRAVGDLGEVLG